MVKIIDVAQAAKVSVATVSRALNNNQSVDPQLAARVHEAAARLGYRPNAVARSLRRQGTQVWALIITDINNPFYTAMARGVEDVARESGYSLLLCNSDESPEKESSYLAVAEQERTAGVILAPSSPDSDVDRLTSSRIPVVAVDRPLRQPADTVLVKSYEGAVIATEHLLQRGWQRPACITGPSDTATAEQRAAGYASVLRARGMTPVIKHTEYDTEGGAAAVRELFSERLDRRDWPDALFVANSLLALGALSELKQRKIIVGRDLGLVTFDDAPWATVVSPTVTVVAQPAYRIGTEAAEMLVRRIRGEAPELPQTVVLPTELVIRESCRRRPARVKRAGR
jgi:LacI family transcriptional regulator